MNIQGLKTGIRPESLIPECTTSDPGDGVVKHGHSRPHHFFKNPQLDLKHHALTSDSGEFIFGSEHTGSHACYMIYGVLKAGQGKRVIPPGRGHEEMVLAVKGNFEITGRFSGQRKEGCAFHVAGEDTVYLQNTDTTDACYVIAGGHSQDGHHH